VVDVERRVGCVVWLVVLVVAGLWSGRAQAEEKARLVYVRGAGTSDCPDEVDLRLWVIARLGYDPFSPQASRVVLARVEAEQQQLRGSVEVVDAEGKSTGRRDLSSQSERCQELARTMALSISLAIDPERASARPEPLPEPKRAAEAKTAPPPAPSSEKSPEREPLLPRDPPRSAPHVFASLSLTSTAGMLPEIALGGAAGLGARWQRLALALEARALGSLPRPVEPRGQLDGALVGGSAVGCLVQSRLGVCLVGHLAAQRLTASGVSDPAASWGLFSALGARVGLRVALSQPLSVVFALEGLVNLSRNSARLSDTEVWKAPPLSAQLAVGIETHFL
jgi:hypothetical protein